jgi:hypothetical protein
MVIKRLCILVPVFAGLLFLIADCAEFSDPAISVRLALTSPVRLNQPVMASIAVDFRENAEDVGVTLLGEGSVWKIPTFKSWNIGHVASGQHIEVAAPITFTTSGYYTLIASVGTKAGTNNGTSLYLYIDKSGAVFNPTPAYGSGTPVPAAPGSRPGGQ